MTPAALLLDLCVRLGMAPPALDAQGACGLVFDGDQAVDLQFVPALGEMRLAAGLGEADADELQGILLGALLGNLAVSEVGRPHFGYQPASRTLALCQVLPLEGLDGPALAGALRVLVDAARSARGRLAGERLLH